MMADMIELLGMIVSAIGLIAIMALAVLIGLADNVDKYRENDK